MHLNVFSDDSWSKSKPRASTFLIEHVLNSISHERSEFYLVGVSRSPSTDPKYGTHRGAGICNLTLQPIDVDI